MSEPAAVGLTKALVATPELPRARAGGRDVFVGVLCVVGSAVGFSAKAVIAKLGYRHGADPATLLALRMAFSLPFFVGTALWTARGRPALPRRELGAIVVLGVLGYYLASVLDFYGLLYVSAGLERLILFVYPTLVVLISALALGTRITRRVLLALGLTYAGVALAVKTEANLAQGPNVALGVALIFGCAVTYAVYLVGSGQMIPRVGSLRFTALAMIVSSLAMFAHLLGVGGTLVGHAPVVYVDGLLLALICTVLPVFLLGEGIRRVGAGPAAIMGAVGPVSTLVLAYVFLDEPVHLVQVLGMALVVVGATVVARGARA